MREITLSLPDDIYEHLSQRARTSGSSVAGEIIDILCRPRGIDLAALARMSAAEDGARTGDDSL